MIYEKILTEITEEDLKNLITNEVPEDLNLEFKEYLNLDDVEHKKKLLKTVSAFSNTNGGLLICGIKEEDGVAVELLPYDVIPDSEKIRIRQCINSNSEPPIPSVDIEHLNSNSDQDKVFIFIKVPRSWNSPHRIKISKKFKEFYIRAGNQSKPMNIFELKTAFNLSETLIDRIRRFREVRISKILSRDTPIPLKSSSMAVLHLIPINAFYPGQTYPIDKEVNMSDFLGLKPMWTRGFNPRINFDGFLTYNGIDDEGQTNSYVQLYRTGIIEAISTELFDNGNKRISRGFHETKLVESIYEYLTIYKKLNVEMPVFIFITLLGMKGYTMYKERPGERPTPFEHDYEIDRDVLITPEAIIEKYNINIGNILKPTFDSIWNACGYPGSENYNRNNEWEPRED